MSVSNDFILKTILLCLTNSSVKCGVFAVDTRGNLDGSHSVSHRVRKKGQLL